MTNLNILNRIKQIDEQFRKIDQTIASAEEAKNKIDEQIKNLKEQQLILKGQYKAFLTIGQELNEFTISENGEVILNENNENNNNDDIKRYS